MGGRGQVLGMLAVCVAALGAGCDSNQSGTGSGPDASVILQPGAQIADATTCQALKSYDPSSGTLRFDAAAPQVQRWTAGDVAVSGPCPGAPAGFLRRIVSIGKDGTDLVLSTTQAALGDVIKNGGAEGTFQIKSQPSGGGGDAGVVARRSPALGIGDGEHSFHEEETTSNFHFVATGHETNFAGVRLRVNIDGWCAFDGDPCFEFAATVDLQDHFDLDVTASGHDEWNQDIKLFEQTFDPIVLWIGPVPVVFVPHVESHLAMDESVEATVHIAAAGNGPEYEMAVHWDSASGFSFDKASKAASMSGTADFSGNATAHASLPTQLQLLLYDVAGVEARLTPELTAHFQTPGKPLWTLDGRFVGEIGVDAQLPIVGDLGHSDKTLFDESFHIAQSVNSPPGVLIVEPFPGSSYDLSQSTVWLSAHASDAEDGDNCCTIRWALTDGTPLVDGDDVPYTFPRAGHYDLVAIATDSDGASGSSSPVGVDITDLPPGARIVLPSSSCAERLYTGYPVRIRGSDTRPPLAPLPYDCHFASLPLLTGGVDSQFPIAVPPEQVTEDGCDIDTRFGFADYRRLHLLVRQFNPDGSIGLGSIDERIILVRDPPPGAVPIFLEPGPPACAEVLLGSQNGQLELYVQAFGATASGVSWQWQPNGCQAVPVVVTKDLPGVCTPDYCPSRWHVQGSDISAATAPGCGGAFALGQLIVTMTSTAGAPQSELIWVRLFDDTPPR